MLNKPSMPCGCLPHGIAVFLGLFGVGTFHNLVGVEQRTIFNNRSTGFDTTI
jgi:hypothetical protein